MLQDTNDIVMEHRVHPADYAADAEEDATVWYVQRPWKLRRGPNIADDEALAPQLLKLWIRNVARLEGKTFPYEMRGSVGLEQ